MLRVQKPGLMIIQLSFPARVSRPSAAVFRRGDSTLKFTLNLIMLLFPKILFLIFKNVGLPRGVKRLILYLRNPVPQSHPRGSFGVLGCVTRPLIRRGVMIPRVIIKLLTLIPVGPVRSQKLILVTSFTLKLRVVPVTVQVRGRIGTPLSAHVRTSGKRVLAGRAHYA